ncbi:ATP-binding cassette domain-containing protein [Marinobacter halodurans]|uniref:ATP-binding cassette domain-containing protein n=1 Tax=Marinobacter halodurans TaxID=2528979 RepID=A0ABY1ZUD5_9GAMM|nr:ATP-binding cassette domain-containing protein [Marinobacter halodurans]TBW59503.1 ATP-binding cassette domain-containing protein [Marinobacter halodurans]
MLEFENLRFRYPETERVLTFNGEVGAGQCLAVTGPSGCGKSTLLNLVAGFLNAESGTLRWQEQDLQPLPPWERPVTSVFQEGNLFDHLSVQDNLGLGIHPGLKLSRADNAAVAAMLDKVGLHGMARRHPTELSGGQRQRVAVARALLRGTPLLLLDEPFTGLDPDTRQILRQLIRDQREQGAVIVLVSHDASDVESLADRHLVLTA